jgi:hypothetical protein
MKKKMNRNRSKLLIIHNTKNAFIILIHVNSNAMATQYIMCYAMAAKMRHKSII